MTFNNVSTPVWLFVLEIVTSPFAVTAFVGEINSPAMLLLVVSSPVLVLSQSGIFLTKPLCSITVIVAPLLPDVVGLSIRINSFVLTSEIRVLFCIPGPNT